MHHRAQGPRSPVAQRVVIRATRLRPRRTRVGRSGCRRGSPCRGRMTQVVSGPGQVHLTLALTSCAALAKDRQTLARSSGPVRVSLAPCFQHAARPAPSGAGRTTHPSPGRGPRHRTSARRQSSSFKAFALREAVSSSTGERARCRRSLCRGSGLAEGRTQGSGGVKIGVVAGKPTSSQTDRPGENKGE